MKSKTIRYKSAKEFGSAMGLSEIEMELITQKKNLIDILKTERNQRGISQTKLAEIIGSKQPTIARMESGQVAEISMDFLLKVALALELSVSIKAGTKVA